MMFQNTLYVIFILQLQNFQHISTLHIKNVIVPKVVDQKDSATLQCTYHMGTHKLNSVKWYKDGDEFFRYAPMMIPNIMTFPVKGIHLSNERQIICNTQMCVIHLEHLNSRTSGSYRCEISGDAPEFNLVEQTTNMTVAVLPKHDPLITGLKKFYSIGDQVMANCTSDISSPPPYLSWYINDMIAHPDFVQAPQEVPIETNDFQLHYKSLVLSFAIERARFGDVNGEMKLTCSSRIIPIPIANRKTTVSIFVPKLDDLVNQKLINSSNSDKHRNFSLIVIIFITFQFHRIFNQF